MAKFIGSSIPYRSARRCMAMRRHNSKTETPRRIEDLESRRGKSEAAEEKREELMEGD